MRRKAPVQFGNRWLEKYRPAILQEGSRLEKAENITSCKSREYNGNSPATKFIKGMLASLVVHPVRIVIPVRSQKTSGK